MIRLYSIPPSLYSAKVRLVLRAKGVAFEDVPPPGGYGSDAYREIVPSGTLPAIDHGGFMLADSEAINEYLNELQPMPPMWPADMRTRAHARALSRFHDTRLEPGVRALFGHVNPAGRDTVHVGAQAVLIGERLQQLSRLMDAAPLLTGETLSLADCGYAITLTVLELLNDAMALSVFMPQDVVAYYAALKREPNVQLELQTYRPAMESWIASALAGCG